MATNVLRRVLISCLLLSLAAGCQSVPQGADDLTIGSVDPSSASPKRQRPQGPVSDFVTSLLNRSHEANRDTRYVEDEGTDLFLKNTTADRDPIFDVSEADDGSEAVTLNLVNVEIAQAAKTVLGDMLSLNYLIDPKVSGAITVQTTNPVSLSMLADIFDAVLRANGAAIVDDGSGIFKVVPSNQALSAMPGLRITRDDLGTRRIGVGIQVVPLEFVSVSEMQRLLQPIAPQGSILLADAPRNLLMLAGTRKELAALLETIEMFDVDWMQGMSFALVPLRSSDPEAISQELETVFSASSGGANSVVRFVPNKRLRSILVIASRKRFLRSAKVWIDRLDTAAAGTERQLYVYNIQNRTALELAGLLQEVFAAQAGQFKVSSSVAPRFEESEVRTERPRDPDLPPISDDRMTADALNQADVANNPDGVHIVADESNNALLVLASPKNYRRVLEMLTKLDSLQNQVLLEATIAEVTLNDELKFGVRWFLEKADSDFIFSDAATGAIASVFPGFSYVLSKTNARVILNAVSGVTDVNVISSPTLMVLDNKTAELQVGDQVPIATQSAVSVVNPGAPIVNSIELKDTGVILRVTPRVNDSGRVILEIEQEVSDVVSTTTSGIDSPTIQQRKIKTTVVVNDGDSLALGGLIQKRHSDGRTKVPIVGDIPLVGTLFREKTDTVRRTELLILITPRVVRDLLEAQEVTREFRRQLNVSVPEIRKGRQPPEAEARRIFH